MIDHDKLKKRLEGGRATGQGWKPKEGENRVFVLPPNSALLGRWEAMEDIAVTYDMHYFRIEGRQPTEVSRCLRELKQQCPACDAYWAHYKSEDPALKELAKQVRAATTYLMNILDINNLAAGIQIWGGNYTCWSSVLEIAANPQWGNVLDPAAGHIFTVKMTPATKSHTGHNSYAVIPEPQPISVMEILNQIPEWPAKLDTLTDRVTEAKTAEEIQSLLDEMGFPPPPPKRGHAAPVPAPVQPVVGIQPVPGAVLNIGVQPAPAQSGAMVLPPTPVQPVVVQPVTVQPAAPVMVQPVTVQPAAPVMVQPLMVTAPAPVQPAPIATMTGTAPMPGLVSNVGVHYDPGPRYTPKTPDGSRPAGVPRCFGDYNPGVHQCQPCPVMAECQFKLLGIAG